MFLVGLLFDFDISDGRHDWGLYALGGRVDRWIITEVESYDKCLNELVYSSMLRIQNRIEDCNRRSRALFVKST